MELKVLWLLKTYNANIKIQRLVLLSKFFSRFGGIIGDKENLLTICNKFVNYFRSFADDFVIQPQNSITISKNHVERGQPLFDLHFAHGSNICWELSRHLLSDFKETWLLNYQLFMEISQFVSLIQAERNQSIDINYGKLNFKWLCQPLDIYVIE